MWCEFTKVLSYIRALAFVMLDVVLFVGMDYDKLNGENILGFAFIVANCIIWTFYFIRKFYIEFSKEAKND